MKKYSEVLEEGLSFLLNEKTWTQGAMARDVNSQSISPLSDAAVCFCSIGVLYKLGHKYYDEGSNDTIMYFGDHRDKMYHYLQMAVRSENLDASVSYANDHFSRAKMIEIWRHAIQQAQIDELKVNSSV